MEYKHEGESDESVRGAFKRFVGETEMRTLAGEFMLTKGLVMQSKPIPVGQVQDWLTEFAETLAARPSVPEQGQGAKTPLTYEQEVHALLYKGVTFGEDLIRYFMAQAKQETGDRRKLTEKCIVFAKEDVERFRTLIPEALKRRDALTASRA